MTPWHPAWGLVVFALSMFWVSWRKYRSLQVREAAMDRALRVIAEDAYRRGMREGCQNAVDGLEHIPCSGMTGVAVRQVIMALQQRIEMCVPLIPMGPEAVDILKEKST